MPIETALRINSAALFIGLALLGVLDHVTAEHVALIRSVSLAQMETATEIVEAYNAAAKDGPGPHKIYSICEQRLLANVKTYADSVKV